MREMIGTKADILFDLEQIKLLSQEKTELNRGQQDEVDRLPTRKAREKAKEEMLAKKERRKKEFLRIWTIDVEERVKRSGLPPDIVNQILEMTAYAKERDMTFIYDVERRIEQLEIQIREAEEKRAAQEAKEAKDASVAAMSFGAVVAGAAIAPFVQVRYNKEEYEKKTTEYYEDKLAKVLAFGTVKERSAAPVYKVKKSDSYSKRHTAVETAQKDELLDAIVRDAQTRNGSITGEEVKAKLAKMYPMQRKVVERAIYQANPEMKARHEAQKKEVAAQETLNGLLRAKRVSQKAALKALETQKARLMKEARTPETTEQIAAQLAVLDERIAVHQKEVASMGLFVDNFEKVLKQNNTTASQILNAVTVKGRRNMDVLTDQVMQMNMQGMSMQYAPKNRTMAETQQAQARGISARLKETVQAPKVPGEQGKQDALQREVEKRAQGLWTAKQATKTGDLLRKHSARKVIRPKLKPKSEKEKLAARELVKIMAQKKAGKNGMQSVLKENSAVKSEKRVRDTTQLLLKKSYDRAA